MYKMFETGWMDGWVGGCTYIASVMCERNIGGRHVKFHMEVVINIPTNSV
jgi:hypothetical protein